MAVRSSSSEDVYGKKRTGCAACVHSTPWLALLATGLFAAGLVLWVSGAVKLQQAVTEVAEAIDVAPAATDSLRSAVLTAILAIGISGLVSCVLVVLLAGLRTGLGTALTSRCGGKGTAPSPCAFTTLRALVGFLNAVVWLLLLAVVVVLAATVVLYGISAGIDSAVSSSRAAARAAGIDVNSISDGAAAIQAFITPLARTAADLLGGGSQVAGGLASTVCAPICLNLGSVAPLLRASSCVCGGAKLDAIGAAASEATKVGALALAGAAAMYVGATLLLMLLTAQFVRAKYERSTARHVQRRLRSDAENGYLADPADCVVQPDGLADVAGAHGQRDAASAAYPPVAMHPFGKQPY